MRKSLYLLSSVLINLINSRRKPFQWKFNKLYSKPANGIISVLMWAIDEFNLFSFAKTLCKFHCFSIDMAQDTGISLSK